MDTGRSAKTNIAELAAFMPIDRQHALVRGISLPDRTTGTALFADISGFTALTGALMHELGPKRGAEEVLVYLNPVFDALISELHRYGGVVIGFAGDSITCWLDGDDGRRAIACALAMQEVMKPYQSMQTEAGTPFSLHIKVAVAAGPARRFAVGSPDFQLVDVLAGETLIRMAAAEGLAEKGDTVVEASILSHLGDLVAVDGWRTNERDLRVGIVTGLNDAVTPAPWPKLHPGALTEEKVQSWLLPPVHARIKAGQAFLAELRPAVALFLRFTGLDYDRDEAAGEKLNAYISWVQGIISRYDGYLIQLTVGDKGSFLYVAFGAPISRGNNAVRAVGAALDLRARSTNFEGIEQVQIGVSAGRMWTGAYGGRQRRTYGVMGNETNMAARLMSKATAGQIMVTGQVVETAKPHYHFHSLGAIVVKGRTEPLPVWEVAGRQQGATGEWSLFTKPLVGRREQLVQLEKAISAVKEGDGRIVRLVGEAGMGKSHLAAEFSQLALGQHVQLAVGACQSITQSSSYHPWRQIFRTMLNLDDSTEEEAVAQLTVFLKQKHPTWVLRLPLLGDLLALPIPDNPTTAALDAGMRQKALFSLVAEMVQMWALYEPLLLVIENAHWLDETSIALIQMLAKQVVGRAPVVLLLVHRPEMMGDASLLPDLADLPYLITIPLPEMSDDEVAALILNRLTGSPEPLLLSIVQAMTRGNPFFVGELIEAMQQSEQLARQEDGSWRVSDELFSMLRTADFLDQVEGTWDLKPNIDLSTLQLGIPDSIHGIVLSRLDRLPESHKLTLKVSSVIGHQFSLYLVANAHPEQLETSEIEVEARDMEAEDLVHQELHPQATYTFHHHATQEVAYETLLYTQRQQLHRAVAQSLVDLEPDAVSQIAHHAFTGEAWPLSLKYNLLAGEQAKQLYANQQAVDFYGKALRSAEATANIDTAQQRKIIHLSLGELLISTGEYEAAGEHLDSALALAQSLGDKEAQARACRWFGRSNELRGEYPPALDWLDKGLAILDGQRSSEEAEISLIAGLIYIRQGDYDRALQLCERSLQVAQEFDDTAVRARTYNVMGIVDRRRGNSTTAVERFHQSLEQYEKIEDVYGQATSHNLIANGYFMRGAWSDADFHYRRSLEMFNQIGDTYNQVLVNNNLGGIALKQGRLDAALGYYQRAVRLLELIGGSLWVFGALHMNIANARIHRRELDQATEELTLAKENFEQAQLRELLPELYGLFAEAALLQENLDEAVAHGLLSLDLARELQMPLEEGHNLRILGDIALAQHHYGRAEEYFKESSDILEGASDEYEHAKVKLSLAELYVKEDKRIQAMTLIKESEEVFERLSAALDLRKARHLKHDIEKSASV